MAESTLTVLAARLTDHADSIVKVAAHQLETDLREAAAVIREIEAPTPVIPKLVAELTRLAVVCRDLDTRNSLLTLLGRLA